MGFSRTSVHLQGIVDSVDIFSEPLGLQDLLCTQPCIRVNLSKMIKRADNCLSWISAITMLTRIGCQRRSTHSLYILELYIWRKISHITQVLSNRLVGCPSSGVNRYQLTLTGTRNCQFGRWKKCSKPPGQAVTAPSPPFAHLVTTLFKKGLSIA